MLEWLQQEMREEKELWLQEWKQLLSFPSIRVEKERQGDLLACAAWVEKELLQMGFYTEKWGDDAPVIFGEYRAMDPHQPTLLLYNHYDVQPVDPLELWQTPPFEAVERQGQVYARGAQDNKGQLFYVLQALKRWIRKKGALPIHVKWCIEGEEEAGSATLLQILESKKEQLKADYLLIVDTGLADAKTPAMTLGVRGLVSWDVEVECARSDLHSGMHGGLALNPIQILVELLASCKNREGRVLLPDFYPEKESSLADFPALSNRFDPLEYEKEMGIPPVGGERVLPPLVRAWLRPTFEINGICGGYTGPGLKTVIPAKASAKVSCRLIPGQDPEKIGQSLFRWMRERAPEGSTVTVSAHEGGGKALWLQPGSDLVRACSVGLKELFHKNPDLLFCGASIPVAAALAEVSGAETLFIGLGLPEDQIHAPNEHFGIDRVEKGTFWIASILQELQQ